VVLQLYPADTLTQARVRYRDAARVKRLLALRKRGEELRPDFHFGFVTRGFTNTQSRLDAGNYAAYWIARIDQLTPFGREDWERELQYLIADGIFRPRGPPPVRPSRTPAGHQPPGFTMNTLTRRWPVCQGC
jgi:hypothetical protein